MNAHLMYRDRDLDLQAEMPINAQDLVSDLELEILFRTMAQGDKLVFQLARQMILSPLTEREAITYRQDVLTDCLENPSVVRQIYELASATVYAERRVWGPLVDSPGSILRRSVDVLEIFVGSLKRLRNICDGQVDNFRSEGFLRFFAMVAKELDDDYIRTIEKHLRELQFRRGVLISAQLSTGNAATNHVLRRVPVRSLRQSISRFDRSRLSYQVDSRDDVGSRVLDDLRSKGINLVANALAQSADHIQSFFAMLMAELAFYVGGLNLHEQLAAKGEPTCFPDPQQAAGAEFSVEGLYDPCLSLLLEGRAIGNDVNADDRWLVMITGANQGGKSTFLRSVGVAQLMMQSGMFVPAKSFRANICEGVFTHFKREEDPSMKSGKLDEELGRMSEIASSVTPNCIVLCNESFASTNEREGSEIARQVIHTLTDARVKVLFVTHLFELADGLFTEHLDTALFLRAERLADGRRTLRLVEGEPLPTSYGEDSYRRIFAPPPPAPGEPARSSLQLHSVRRECPLPESRT